VVLVGHDSIKAHLIGAGILLVILIVQGVGSLRIKIGVREGETRRVLFEVRFGDVTIRLLRVEVDFNLIHRYFLLVIGVRSSHYLPEPASRTSTPAMSS
jgi:hypothetical protein